MRSLSVNSSGPMGLSRRVGHGHLDSLKRTRLLWWSDVRNLLAGFSLEPQHPDLLFWYDASDLGWGANLVDQFVSGLWSPEEGVLSSNLRELKAIRLSLHHFWNSLRD